MKTKTPRGDDPALDVTSTAERPDDYSVGYRKPPVKSRFAKGVSGNPKGFPRGGGRMRPSLKDILAEKIDVREGPRTRKISKYEALMTVLVNAALKGDTKALLKILSMVPASAMREHERLTERPTPVTSESAERAYMRLLHVREED
jgi:Family of unknown function (DUF5681)